MRETNAHNQHTEMKLDYIRPIIYILYWSIPILAYMLSNIRQYENFSRDYNVGRDDS